MADLARWRRSYLSDRADARRDLVLGLASIGSAAPAAWVSTATNDVVLLLGTIYVPVALGFGLKYLIAGIARHAAASLRLRELHRRDTGLPPARLVD